MNHLGDIQSRLRSSELNGLIVPTTDEFLSEFSPPANRRLRWATGFGGSTGIAVILRNAAALFLDGRYVLQGKSDIDGAPIDIEPAGLPARNAWLKRALPQRARIGMDPWCHSALDLAQWRALSSELGFELELLAENPIDRLWRDDRPSEHRPPIADYPPEFAGETYQAKCTALVDHVKAAGLQALLVADPEDVSWLLNVRAADEALKTKVGEWHIVPSCTSRALVQRDGRVIWFVDRDRLTSAVAARGESLVTISTPDSLSATLREASLKGPIGAHLSRTPAALVSIIEQAGEAVADDTVARRRWRKHPNEVQGAKRTHITDAIAVVRFMAWLAQTVPQRAVTEFEAAEKLAALRAEHPDYKGPSMPLMSASGTSSAQPHYVPRPNSALRLNDHPIYWMDSGGQYPGGSTDNTLTLALGAPEPKHILAHTLVLKGYVALATARFPAGSYGVHLDTIARQALWSEGLNCPHGIGHGVGNCLNIHEGPGLSREPGPLSTVPLEPGMIVTNEPGYYLDGDFGVRIESHMVVVESRRPGFLELETISRLPIDPRLVDFARLSSPERQWLADYHRTVLADLEPRLDASSAVWLRTLAETFIGASAA